MELQEAPEAPTQPEAPEAHPEASPSPNEPESAVSLPEATEEVDLNSTFSIQAPQAHAPPQPVALEHEASRPRSETVASAASTRASVGSKPPKLLSGVLIVSSLEQLLNSKEAKKNAALKEATQTALDAFKTPTALSVDPRVVLQPLKLACETKSNALVILALDCIGKLVSHAGPAPSPTASVPDDASRRTSISSVEAAGTPIINLRGPDHDLANQLVEVVCSCFIDTSSGSTSSSSSVSASSAAAKNPTGPEAVNLHILSALLSLILSTSDALPVHQSALLLAVRTVYNVFLLSKGHQNQMVAQGALGQIVAAVFGRVQLNYKIPPSQKSVAVARLNRREEIDSSRSSVDTVRATPDVPEIAVQPGPAAEDTDPARSVPAAEEAEQVAEKPAAEAAQPDARPEEEAAQADEAAKAPSANNQPASGEQATETKSNGHAEPERPPAVPPKVSLQSFEEVNDTIEDSENGPTGPSAPQDLAVRDAFLVFRALCRLSMKALTHESEKDLRSHAMRSKLLSLNLILSILHNHPALFVDPTVGILSNSTGERTPFIVAVKQYLCLSISRNALSPVINVFELACEIFWRVLSGMRNKLKKEIEVLLNEIFLPILEMRTSTMRQKAILLNVLSRLCRDPRALVELYINYDCDRNSIENIYERFINIISKMSTTHFTSITPAVEKAQAKAAEDKSGQGDLLLNPSLFTGSSGILADSFDYSHMTIESRLRRQSLESVVVVLKSLVAWAGKGIAPSGPASVNGSQEPVNPQDGPRRPDDAKVSTDLDNLPQSVSTPDLSADDPGRFESAKQRKTMLLEGIKKFNFKPKRGIKFLLEAGFIKSNSAEDIAQFLLHGDGFNKAALGEYLGEGDDENVAIMHAFVDRMDFTSMRFVDALRTFLQSFRLPGEAQKIDRFVLKFADRYVQGNPSAFANADTAYVLAYSVILLNTDLYNPQNKNRMSKPEFIRNNRGINDGQDLSEDLLNDIYDEISVNEIRMKDEIVNVTNTATGFAASLANVGRDLQREQYDLESEGMANKTEALFRSMVRTSKRSNTPQQAAVGPSRTEFFEAVHFEHVKPMFAVAWMPILAGLSAPLQSTEMEDKTNISLALEGFRQSIKIVCLFDLELERNAFVTTLAKFTGLISGNFQDMKLKHVEVIRCLLDLASVNGNYLKSSWREILTCVSQLERLHLLVTSVGESEPSNSRSRQSKQASGSKRSVNRPTEEVAQEVRATQITNAADRIFATSNTLSGTAIVDFVQALAHVSWQEIANSALTPADTPRTFSLQKLVEIAYYNMSRIRLEWSNMWAILGDHFNQVCCHTNSHVSFFALDSLRQLASRFLEKEELSHFKFQKDFLKPFEYAMVHNTNPDVRDMILQCIRQMLMARVNNLRSGWRTMFGVFSAASKVMVERIASQAFEMVQQLKNQHFDKIITHGSFADLTVCITDFAKINKFQKISLTAIEMLRSLVPQMLSSPECPLSTMKRKQAEGKGKAKEVPNDHLDDPMIKFWFPLLFGFYDVIMNGEDLEVRKRSLDYLFDTLKAHGSTFSPSFWDVVAKDVLFPIFAVLRSRHDVSRFSTQEDMSVWLSTTMIQALRNLVDLFTFYFDLLGKHLLDRLLDLLAECICQENDTLARIGTACLQQLVEQNAAKLSAERWSKIVDTFITLFSTTTAHQLFDERLRMPLSPAAELPESPRAPSSGFVAPLPLSPGLAPDDARILVTDRKRAFRQIIVKCVLQLLLIETAHELLQNEQVYFTIPPAELLKLMSVLDDSYRFAKRFNADRDLRTALWKVGFMKQLPNLLKQESSSAAVLVTVLLRMYNDAREDHLAKRSETVQAFTPLGLQIVSNYITLEQETQARNIAAWTPVVVEVLQGFSAFQDETLSEHSTLLYPLAVDLLARDLAPEVRESLRGLFYRIGVVNGLVQYQEEEDEEPSQSSNSENGQDPTQDGDSETEPEGNSAAESSEKAA